MAYLATDKQSVHTGLRTFWQSRHQAQPYQSINLTVQPPGSSNVAIYEFCQTSHPTPAKYSWARINLNLTFIKKYLTIKRQLLSIKDLDYKVTTGTSQWTHTCSWFQLGGVTPGPDIKRNQYSMTVFIINILLFRICSNSEIIIFKLLSIFGGPNYMRSRCGGAC